MTRDEWAEAVLALNGMYPSDQLDAELVDHYYTQWAERADYATAMIALGAVTAARRISRPSLAEIGDAYALQTQLQIGEEKRRQRSLLPLPTGRLTLTRWVELVADGHAAPPGGGSVEQTLVVVARSLRPTASAYVAAVEALAERGLDPEGKPIAPDDADTLTETTEEDAAP